MSYNDFGKPGDFGEEIMKRRLVTDGDGRGDDRKIGNFMQDYASWATTNNPSADDSQEVRDEKKKENADGHRRLLMRLQHIKNLFMKTTKREHVFQSTKARYDNLQIEIHEEIESLKQNIIEVKEHALTEFRLKQQKTECEAMMKLLKRLPKRKQTEARFNKLSLEISCVKDKVNRLEATIATQRQKLALLIQCSKDIAETLKEEQSGSDNGPQITAAEAIEILTKSKENQISVNFSEIIEDNNLPSTSGTQVIPAVSIPIDTVNKPSTSKNSIKLPVKGSTSDTTLRKNVVSARPNPNVGLKKAVESHDACKAMVNDPPLTVIPEILKPPASPPRVIPVSLDSVLTAPVESPMEEDNEVKNDVSGAGPSCLTDLLENALVAATGFRISDDLDVRGNGTPTSTDSSLANDENDSELELYDDIIELLPGSEKASVMSDSTDDIEMVDEEILGGPASLKGLDSNTSQECIQKNCETDLQGNQATYPIPEVIEAEECSSDKLTLHYSSESTESPPNTNLKPVDTSDEKADDELEEDMLNEMNRIISYTAEEFENSKSQKSELKSSEQDSTDQDVKAPSVLPLELMDTDVEDVDSDTESSVDIESDSEIGGDRLKISLDDVSSPSEQSD